MHNTLTLGAEKLTIVDVQTDESDEVVGQEYAH